MADDHDSTTSVATWRVLTLFLFIIAIDLICEFGNEAITHHFRHRQHSGLLHAWEQLKFETMALGLVSLLLIVGEEQLLKICIDSSSKVDSAPDSVGNDTQRRLLAKAVEHSCPDGQEPVWESKLIHKAHLLIFLIAAVHILYSIASIGLSLLAMKRWKRFEKQVTEAAEPLPEPWAVQKGHGKSGMLLGLAQLIRQCYRPLDLGTYAALRRHFLDKMQVAPDFDFAAFVSDYLAEEFSSVVKFDIFMWLLAIVWVAFPNGWYAGFVITACFIALSIASGAKLHAVAINMALRAPPAATAAAAAPAAPADVSVNGLGRGGSPGGAEGGASGTQAEGSPPLPPSRAAPSRVSVPAAIAEGIEDVSATADQLLPPSTPRSGPATPAAAPAPPVHASATPLDGSGGATGGAAAGATRRHRTDPQALFWFGKPRLMLRIFRYAYFENALALAVLVFGFWKDGGAVFGREAQFGRGPAAIAWLAVDTALLLLLHSSMFLLPLYSLTAAAAEFSNPEYVLEFARERGIRADLVAFLEATEPEDDDEKAEVDDSPQAQATFSLPAYSPRPHSPSRTAAPPPASPRPAPAVRAADPQTPHNRIPRPKSTPRANAAAADAATADEPPRPHSGSAQPAAAAGASRLSKLSCPPAVTDVSPAPGGLGGPYTQGPGAPVPLPAAVRSSLLQRVSAAGMLQRQSVPCGPSAAGGTLPSLQRPSVPCTPYSYGGLLQPPRPGGAAAGAEKTAAAAATGANVAPPAQELRRRSGLARMSVAGRLTMMADVALGTDFLERSAQVNAPHGGNVARAADDAAAVTAHTAAPAPLAITASRHAHSVQGLLEAMALQRMVQLSRTAVADMHAPGGR